MENVVSLCSVFTPKRQLTRPENCNSPVMGYYYEPHNTLCGKVVIVFSSFPFAIVSFFNMSETFLKVTIIAVIVSYENYSIHLDSNSIENFICKNQVFHKKRMTGSLQPVILIKTLSLP